MATYFLSRETSSSLPLRSRRQTILNASAVLRAMNTCKIKSTGGLDLLKLLVERVRTRGSSKAGREADGMDTNQVRTKATHGSNAYYAGGKSIVWSCSRARAPALRVALSSAHMDPMYPNTESAKILRSHSRSTRLLVEALIFITHWMNFSRVPSNGECGHPVQSWCPPHYLANLTICIS